MLSIFGLIVLASVILYAPAYLIVGVIAAGISWDESRDH